MNTPRPPMEPLDAQEREFARILHALPGGEPPPGLDAAILRSATNAAAASKRPGARFLASAGALWGIGTAAAAVLALGVAWQMRYGDTRAPLAESAARAHVVAERAEDDAVQVDLGPAPESAPAPMSAPPPPPPEELAQQEAPPAALRRQRVAQPARDAAPSAAAAAPAPAPEAFAADQLDEHVAREAAAAANAAEAELELKGRSEEAASKLAAKRAAAVAAPAAPPPAAATAEAQSRSDTGNAAPVAQDSDSASGSALGGLAGSSAKPAVRKPASWLTEIRALRDQGRIEEARAALIEFRKKYPKWVIPTDLAPLLSE